MRFLRLSGYVVFAFLLSLTTVARAQSVDTGGLEVDIRDASGALIPGATLTLTQTNTHDARTGVSDAHGRYRFTEMPVGSYELTVSKSGFAETVQKGITLSVGQAAQLQVALSAGAASETIQVQGDVSTVDPDRTTIGQTISSEEIENLPSNGRNFLDFVVTVPGVSTTTTTGQNSGFSVNGQRSRSNSIMIDGVENNGDFNGNVRQTLSQDAIAQFQVLTEQFPAEFGGAGGGFINVVTKAGSDQYHGSAYYFVRDSFLDWQNKFNSNNPNTYLRNDVGMSVGGPIKSNRTFFFGALEYIGLNTSQNSYMSAYAAAVNPTLAAGKFIGSPVTSLDTAAFYPVSSALTLSSIRIDHRFTNRDTFIGRVIYDQYIQANSTNIGGYFDISAGTGTYTHTQNYFTEWTHIFSPTLINEVHIMVAPQRLKQLPNTYGPGADIAGSVNIGPTQDFPVTLDEDHYEADDALSKTLGAHLFKAGFQMNYIRAHSVFPTQFAGQWNFYTTGNFASGIPYQYSQGFGNADNRLNDTLLGFYLEDSWKAFSRLTVNYGVRYDLDLQPQGFNLNNADPIQANLPKGIPRDYNNFAPRLGVAYALDKNGKTVLRAGYGLFYDKNLLIMARNQLQTKQTLTYNYNNSTVAALDALWKVGPFPQSATYPTAPGIAPSITSVAPNMVIPMIHQADFGIDRAITSRLVFSVTGVHVAGEKLLKAANANLAPPIVLTSANQTNFGYAAYNGTNTCNSIYSSLGKAQPCFQQYGRPLYLNYTTGGVTYNSRTNQNFNDITTVGPWGHSNYNGMRVTLVQNAWHGLTARAGYVWSRAEDDAPDFLNGALANNPYDPHSEKSLSNEDVRNRFTGALVYRTPFRSSKARFDWQHVLLANWIFSGTITEGSGTPENITIGSDINYDDSSTDRPFINGVMSGRNTFRGARQSSITARGQKELRLPRGERLLLSAEVFNLTNHTNYTDYYTLWGTGQKPTSANYGLPDTTSQARIMQLGIRYNF